MKLTLSQIEDESPEGDPFVLDLEDGTEDVIFTPPSKIPAGEFLADDLLTPAGTRRLLGLILTGEDEDRVMGRLSLGAMQTVMSAYFDHYGMGSLGEGSASPALSNRAARRSKPTSKRKA